MASLEDRVKELERRASSGDRARIGLAVKVDLLEKRLQKLEKAAAPPGVPQDAAPRWHSDLKFVEESRFAGKTSEQIFDEGYDEGLAAGRGEKEALIDQLTDELTESREKAQGLQRRNDNQRRTICSYEQEIARQHKEIRRLREQVDILQASHGSRGEVSKPAPEFKKGDLVKIVGPSISGLTDRLGELTQVTQVLHESSADPDYWVARSPGSSGSVYKASSLDLVERAS